MATNTPNLDLRKPDLADLVNPIADINENMDDIDSKLGPIMTAWGLVAPTWGSTSGTQPAIGNGTLQAWIKVIGKVCFYRILWIAGTTTTYGTAAAWYFTIPGIAWKAGRDQVGIGAITDASPNATYRADCILAQNTNVVYPIYSSVSGANVLMAFLGPAAPVAFAVNDVILLNGVGEIN